MELSFQLVMQIKDLSRHIERVKHQLEISKRAILDKVPYGEQPGLLEKQLIEAYKCLKDTNNTLQKITDLADQIERRAEQW